MGTEAKEGDPRLVRDYMQRRVVTIQATDTVSRACHVMQRESVGALPVVREGTPVGMLTDRDVVLRVWERSLRPEVPVEQVMTTGISFVPPDWPLARAARRMEQLGLHRLAVVDGDLSLVGILSIDDLPRELRPPCEATV